MTEKGGCAHGEVELVVTDSSGKVIQRVREKCHSFLYWFAWWFSSILLSGGGAIRDAITGQDVSCLQTSWTPTKVEAPAGNDSYGIWIGTGSAPNEISTYTLQSKIPHGTGSNKMQYGETVCSMIDSSNFPIMRFEITRSFTNNSGGNITVREIGLVMQHSSDGSSINARLMICRDVLSSPVTVPNGGILYVKYYIRLN